MGDEDDGGGVSLPFAWTGVELFAQGAGALRVRLQRLGSDGVSLAAADETGAPVVRVASLLTRPITAAQLAGAGGSQRNTLFYVDWVTAPAAPPLVAEEWVVLDGSDLDAIVGGGGLPPAIVLADLYEGNGLPASAHEVVHRVLALIQAWLTDERFAASRLVLLTHGAVAARIHDAVDGLAQAGAWGLVRTAQSENPGRFTLIDHDGLGDIREVLPRALACEESQIAIRDGEVLIPRLDRVHSDGALAPPAGAAEWRLDCVRRGTFEGLELVPSPRPRPRWRRGRCAWGCAPRA